MGHSLVGDHLQSVVIGDGAVRGVVDVFEIRKLARVQPSFYPRSGIECPRRGNTRSSGKGSQVNAFRASGRIRIPADPQRRLVQVISRDFVKAVIADGGYV